MIPPSCIDRDCQHLRQILHSATSTAAHVIPWVYSDISSCRACAIASRGTAATARSCIDGRAHVWYVLLWGAAGQRPPTGNTHATRVVNRKPHTAHCIAECETVWMRVSPAHSHGHLAPSVTLVRIGLSSSSGRRLPPPHVKRPPQQMQPQLPALPPSTARVVGLHAPSQQQGGPSHHPLLEEQAAVGVQRARRAGLQLILRHLVPEITTQSEGGCKRSIRCIPCMISQND
jgi:hypothetical protein